MRKNLSGLLVIVFVAIFFSSCATIFTGTKDRIYFDSEPQGARVIIDRIEVCKTPCSENVKRELSSKTVEIKLDGYTTRFIKLDQSFNAVSVLNLLNGLVGWVVDAATGSLMKYDRKSYNIELEQRLSQVNVETIEVDTEGKILTFYVME